jgi:hypothetical protein
MKYDRRSLVDTTFAGRRLELLLQFLSFSRKWLFFTFFTWCLSGSVQDILSRVLSGFADGQLPRALL